MAYFKLTYGISNDEYTEYIEASCMAEAIEQAYTLARDTYDSYAGLHGIPSVEEIAYDMFIDRFEHECDEGEEDFLDDYYDAGELWGHLTDDEREAAYLEYSEERESWINFEAKEVTKEEYENGEELDDEED